MALHVALRGLSSKCSGGGSLAGCLAMSAWLPFRDEYPACLAEEGAAAEARLAVLPVLQCHGDADPVVPYAWGPASFNLLATNARLQKANNQQKEDRERGRAGGSKGKKDRKTDGWMDVWMQGVWGRGCRFRRHRGGWREVTMTPFSS